MFEQRDLLITDTRHEYIIQCISNVLDISFTEANKLVHNSKQLEKMNLFFSVGRAATFLFEEFLNHDKKSQSESVYYKCLSDEVFGGNVHRCCVVFTRVNKNIPIRKENVHIESNMTVLDFRNKPFLSTIQETITNVFMPSIQASMEQDCDHEEKTSVNLQLLESLKCFVYKLGMTQDCLDDIVVLSPCATVDLSKLTTPSMFLATARSAATLELVENHTRLWIKQIEQVLAESEQMRREADDVGPKFELKYWKKRLSKFNSLLIEVKSQKCKAAIGVLLAARSKLIKVWKELDKRITDYTNEAKDNVKFLYSLEKFCEPLYNCDPVSMMDSLAGLLNTVQMVHTYSRYYHTSEHMTSLFTKITNRMINACRSYINDSGKNNLFEQHYDTLLLRCENCLKLNAEYQSRFSKIKKKIEESESERQFDFSETYIFGKMNAFMFRVNKIKHLVCNIKMYESLESCCIEGIQSIQSRYQALLSSMKSRSYDYLDYRNVKFKVDYDEFISSFNELQMELVEFLEIMISKAPTIPISLNMLSRFKGLNISSLEIPIHDAGVDLLQDFTEDLEKVVKIYQTEYENPSIARNVPPTAGKIAWARQLFRRIQYPMGLFQKFNDVMNHESAKKVICIYNKTAKVLIQFEMMCHQTWLNQINTAKSGIHCSLLVKDPQTNKLLVNFDPDLLLLLREMECMTKMELHIPEQVIFLMNKQTLFKSNYGKVQQMVAEYDRVMGKVPENFYPVITRHLMKLDSAIDPGIFFITWASINLNSYVSLVYDAISEFELMIDRANNIVQFQITKLLKEMECMKLCELPVNEPWTIKQFQDSTMDLCKKAGEVISSKSLHVKEAVNDLILMLMSLNNKQDKVCETDMNNALKTRLGSVVIPLPHLTDLKKVELQESLEEHAHDLYQFFHQQHTETLLKVIRVSLDAIRRRILNSNVLIYGKDAMQNPDMVPFFQANFVLKIPDVTINPTVEDIQSALKRCFALIIGVSKRVIQWQSFFHETPMNDIFSCSSMSYTSITSFGDYESLYSTQNFAESKRTYFRKVAENKEIIKILNSLLSIVNSQKKDITLACMHYMQKYKSIWLNDKQHIIKSFMSLNPKLCEFEDRLMFYKEIEDKLTNENNRIDVGAVALFADNIKLAINLELTSCITSFGKVAYKKYRSLMIDLFKIIDVYVKKFNKTIEDLNDVKNVMGALKRFLNEEIEVEMQIGPIEESFAMLLKYNIAVSKDDIENVDTLRYSWKNLQSLANNVQAKLLDVQETFREDLLQKTHVLKNEASSFVASYYQNGPALSSISLEEANEKFIMSQYKFDELYQKYLSNTSGEELFGLPVSEYPELKQIHKDLNFLQKLSDLFNDVKKKLKMYFETRWCDVNVNSMMDEVRELQIRCQKLPKTLKDWQAFLDLQKTIDDFNRMCPLIEFMSNKAMKKRHWMQIEEITKHKFDIESSLFVLKNVIDAPLLENKEQIEDVCISAAKEKDIEAKLTSILNEWNIQELVFAQFKNRGQLLLHGESTLQTISVMEDSLMTLNSLQNNRYNLPFKESIQTWIVDLSNSSDILENWMFVQNLWIYLEAVFIGGDIACQLPKEAKCFQNIDKSWQKIMQRAHEISNVIQCCTVDGTLAQLLPHLQEQLEFCQKSLSGYLKKKRMVFPRFFFVSDPALLEILGQATDSHTIQNHLLNVFNNVKCVEFHKKDYNRIVAVMSQKGEVLSLEKYAIANGNVEDWLNTLLLMIRQTVHSVIRRMYTHISDNDFQLEEFFGMFPSQIEILGIQMIWTRDTTVALVQARHDKHIMSETNSNLLHMLNILIEQTTKDLSLIERVKYETLITIHVHQWDIFNSLMKMHIKGAKDFNWLKQLRFYFEKDVDRCLARVTDVEFGYQNEYLGCTERLVITPLTDRCFITLAQALHMSLGGSPVGPAGTGKTETVKDMGKALGKYVVVFNCSDQLDYRGLGRIFKGLSQSGSWGCFDEFNRVQLPVLSVAAQQINLLLTCKKERKQQLLFADGDMIEMNPEFGLFLTMNPGYAGRQELPENLKIQFRSLAMMVPDYQIIIRVKLASCGFINNIVMASKFYTLYKLCDKQLSKQVHYDFGLRNILSVLGTLGKTKRENPHENESKIVMGVLRDMNLSKLIDEDEPLFLSLINDLFPSQTLTKANHNELVAAIDNQCKKAGLINHHTWFMKIMQLYETQLVRHGIMVLGPSGSGKTACIHTLMRALSECFEAHREFRMNPKAVTVPQMFGKLDVSNNDWTNGIFSMLWKKSLRLKKDEHVWIVLDGPVDTIWIENLNSVLDDNKTLTLANGDRIPMSPNCKVIFEPQDIDNASPATVSRNGMIYMSSSGLDWKPILEAWLMKQELCCAEVLKTLFHQSFKVLLTHLYDSLHPKMELLEASYIKQSLDILSGLLLHSTSFPALHVERLYIFAIMWSIGAVLELDCRLKLEKLIYENFEFSLPRLRENETMFEYFVDDTGEWCHWSKKVPMCKPCIKDGQLHYSSIFVPNVDNVCTGYLINIVTSQRKSVLLIGEPGTAKTTMIENILKQYNTEVHLTKTLNFSSATTPLRFQRSIESFVDKRVGNKFGPPSGKRMSVFIDDINMPVINDWGDQVTNEIVRQLMQCSGFYNLEKPGDFKTIIDMQFLAAMIQPGGGRNDLPRRLKMQFSIFNCTLPSNSSIDKIFGVISGSYFSFENGFMSEVVQMAHSLVSSTRKIWQYTKEHMLPTPSKFHYIFNLRDLSRIWQGMLMGTAETVTNVNMLSLLWKHECTRVMSDRFVNAEDKNWFKGILSKVCAEDGIANGDPDGAAYFVNFMRDAGDFNDSAENDLPKVYEQATDMEVLKKRLQYFHSLYNKSVREVGMDIVFFKDAVINLVKISRVISTVHGNMLLVGVGGSGKQSLVRLASYIAGYKTFQLNITKSYTVQHLLDDLKDLYMTAGLLNQSVTFIVTDQDIKDESFLEYINCMLSSGDIPDLYTHEELDDILNDLKPIMKKQHPSALQTPSVLYKYFLKRARYNLHVVLCFSPVGEKFRSQSLKFPGLIGGCTIAWFQNWSCDALIEVAYHFLSNFKIVSSHNIISNVVECMALVHNVVTKFCTHYYEQYHRQVHITPKSFLAFVNSYKQVYSSQKETIMLAEDRMNTGLKKLVEARESIAKLATDLIEKEKVLEVTSLHADKVLKEVTESAHAAEKVKEQVQNVKDQAQNIVHIIADDKHVAEQKLDAAKPALVEAELALQTIKASDIATVRRLGKPPHLIMRIMDCVLILLRKGLDPVKIDYERRCCKPSWSESLRFMSQSNVLQTLEQFPKDLINEEMVELMEPYFEAPDYNLVQAKKVCGNIAGLCSWTQAMCKFYKVNKEVLPLKASLSFQEGKLISALRDLDGAQQELNMRQEELDRAQNEYDSAIAKKQRLVDDAEACKWKMNTASALINGLSSERERWTAKSSTFQSQTTSLVGDILIGTAFLTYAGPFNQEYRKMLLTNWQERLTDNKIPFSEDLSVRKLMVDVSTVAEWNYHGLPNDELSIQNGIIVSQATRYPLLIDPQNQGNMWLRNYQAKNGLKVTSFNHKYFGTHLEQAVLLGQPLLIENVNEELDPIIDNILEKNFIKSGSAYKVCIGEKEVDYMKGFALYLTTTLTNPLFTPEVSARTAVVNFTVTLKGLEDQLLGRVILTEKSELESQRLKLIKDVALNKLKIQQLEDNLLGRLSSVQGSLVDDVTLVEVLRVTKETSEEVNHKLLVAADTQMKINVTREEYRTVATRGSILYFLIVEMSFVNCMYQTSLKKFLQLFDHGIKRSQPSPIPSKRISNIVSFLTYSVYKYTCYGLYEQDKFLFTLLLALQIDRKSGHVTAPEFITFIKGGASLSLNEVENIPFHWLSDMTWLNLVQLSKLKQFSDILNQISSNEKTWKTWFEQKTPEESIIPTGYDMSLDPFRKLLFIRCCATERTLSQARKYILASLGTRYADGVFLDLRDVWKESDVTTPLICFLSMGADPTERIEKLAKNLKIECRVVSIGQGQEIRARRLVNLCKQSGGWVLLQNCHLCLSFMSELLDIILDGRPTESSFRVWLTAEGHPQFPISLLQMSIKFTNEPPSGLKAGLKKTYTGITQDQLDVTNLHQWKPMLYAVAFLHSILQERRKYGSLGWNIPYEFNQADFSSSVQFIQNHLDDMDLKKGVSWSTVRYMLSEVQYGGRVTDDYDKTLLQTFVKVWFSESLFLPVFTFHKDYVIPKCETIKGYLDYLETLPALDSPELYGLHSNADICYQSKKTSSCLAKILSIQPKDQAASTGETRESFVQKMTSDILNKLPPNYVKHEVKTLLQSLGICDPMTIFLKQELERMQLVNSLVRRTLRDLGLAIEGTIIINGSLQDAIDCIYDGLVPKQWLKISWESSTLGFWFSELLERDRQFRVWLHKGRPHVFWMAGFFNPPSFLTAMRQEVTRSRHGWSLDAVSLRNEVLKLYKDDVTQAPSEGVYVHGLYLEGAGWDRKSVKLIEAPAKSTYLLMPVIHMYASQSISAVREPNKYYSCPVYKKPVRTYTNFITTVDLRTLHLPHHWTLRGVALVCDVK